MTTCPRCGKTASLHAPGYGGEFGRPPIFKCYSCDVYGYGFHVETAEAWAESDASRAQSRANAEAYQAARVEAIQCVGDRHFGAVFDCNPPVCSGCGKELAGA